ncbi:hypothetical protein BD414DRAFT_496798 [Trametes punicea]|nr:hypothetical protein BD414DRAFT_496798 [Trametes punicea]
MVDPSHRNERRETPAWALDCHSRSHLPYGSLCLGIGLLHRTTWGISHIDHRHHT